MTPEWVPWVAVIGTCISIFIAITARGKTRIEEIALAKIRDCKEFALQESQDILHKELDKRTASIDEHLRSIEEKIDGLYRTPAFNRRNSQR